MILSAVAMYSHAALDSWCRKKKSIHVKVAAGLACLLCPDERLHSSSGGRNACFVSAPDRRLDAMLCSSKPLARQFSNR